jgi:drug/metabolite transporter (DMT)-like permease
MALLIALRVILSVSANAVQKRLLLDRTGVHHTWIWTYALMLGPATCLALRHADATPLAFWRDILIGGGLDAIGNLAMVAALRGTDLSIFGPLNALRPILALLFGFLWLGEHPSAIGLAGIAITVVGGIVLFTGSETGTRSRLTEIWKPLLLRLTGLALGVLGAVFLKSAAMMTPATVTVAAWIFCGLFVLLAFTLINRRAELRNLSRSFRLHYDWLLGHATVFLAMQWLTIRIFQ